jgi:hypothetical protein
VSPFLQFVNQVCAYESGSARDETIHGRRWVR